MVLSTTYKNKSIVYIIPSLDIGGTEKHLFNLAKLFIDLTVVIY